MDIVDEWLAAAGLSIHTDNADGAGQASKKAKSGKRQGLGHQSGHLSTSSSASALETTQTQSGSATAQAVHGADALLQALKRGKKSGREEFTAGVGPLGPLDADDSRAAAVLSRSASLATSQATLHGKKTSQAGTTAKGAHKTTQQQQQQPIQHAQKKAKLHTG